MRLASIALICALLFCAQRLSAAAALPEFAYRQITVRFVSADGKPVAGASVYGFCRELNLLWPRRDDADVERNTYFWQDEFLEKTDSSGSVKVTVPPGKCGFFAASRTAGAAAWTDFQDRRAGETIVLTAGTVKRWTFASSAGQSLKAKQLFLKPEPFPVWLPIDFGADTKVRLGDGPVHAWASGDANADAPGFVLDFGILGSQIPDGPVAAPAKIATLACTGGKQAAKLIWARYQCPGMDGEIALSDHCTVLLSTAQFTIGYERPLPGGITGVFPGQFYSLASGQSVPLNFDTPLTAALDQDLVVPGGKHNRASDTAKLNARLYLVDGNGQLLLDALDPVRKAIPFRANVTVGGRRFDAPPIRVSPRKPSKAVADATVVSADIGAVQSVAGAIWEFTSPPGLVPHATLTQSSAGADVTVSTATFRTEIAPILATRARNVLVQAELIARAMEQASGRARQHTPTNIVLKPQSGASAGHSGDHITIGSELLFTDAIVDRHPFCHELGHNFQLTHGGLMETIVEAARSGPLPQIGQQPIKWMFFDRMNGIEAKEIGYHNSGLYFYFYAQGGTVFVRYISANEQAAMKSLDKQNFTPDEIETAVCSLALKRDVGPICRLYGLAAEPARVAQAIAAAREVLPRP